MFDNHHHTREIRQTTMVHEHRAPTDESIKLLDEVHEKTLERIISRHSLEENEFKIEWYLIHPSHLDDIEAVCRMNLNGEIRKFSVKICPLMARQDPRKVVEKIRQKAIEELSDMVTLDLLMKNREFARAVGVKP